MFSVEYATKCDLTICQQMDRHISEEELLQKMANRRYYMLKEGAAVIGVMRYNLFWDTVPFLTLLFLNECARGKGYGTQALSYWENEMRSSGFQCTMTSTRADENAQSFYRKLGYKDAGCLILDVPPLSQPTEIFFIKEL